MPLSCLCMHTEVQNTLQLLSLHSSQRSKLLFLQKKGCLWQFLSLENCAFLLRPFLCIRAVLVSRAALFPKDFQALLPAFLAWASLFSGSRFLQQPSNRQLLQDSVSGDTSDVFCRAPETAQEYVKASVWSVRDNTAYDWICLNTIVN